MIFDNYNHLNSNIFYTSENIPTADTDNHFEEQFSEGCTCENLCKGENKCFCLLRSGALYRTNKNIHDTTIIITDSAKPIYECNKSCKCSQFCNNKLVQFGPRPNLKIKLCDMINNHSKGLGLITLNRIRKGNFICEYAGEIITEEETMKRHKQNERLKQMNYIFGIIEHFGEKRIKTFIDPSTFGNIGRYINHSCEPNCEVLTVRVNFVIPKLSIFAKEDIQAGAEITFDYGSENFQNEDVGESKIKCLCASKNCRKYIPLCTYN